MYICVLDKKGKHEAWEMKIKFASVMTFHYRDEEVDVESKWESVHMKMQFMLQSKSSTSKLINVI